MAGGVAGGEEQAHAADHDEGDAGRIEARIGLEAEHVAPECQGFVEIVAAGERNLAERRRACREPAHRLQTEKLVPQPQDATAFGFLIWKDWPIRSSTKSITEPPI